MSVPTESDSAKINVARRGAATGWPVLAAVCALWVCLAVAYLLRIHGDELNFIDLLVYRAGGHAVLSGHSLYGPDFAAVNGSPNGLAFTYPPFSAIVFAPLAMMPAGLAKAFIVVGNAGCGMLLFTLLVVGTSGRWNRLAGWRALTAPIPVRTGVALVGAAVVFGFGVPVQHNFGYGQVNLILAAAVALEILPPSVPWPRGVLVGLATALKLTPAVFIAYFLVTRQWRALAVSLVTVVSTMVISWLVMPADTVRYFTSTLFAPGRIGGLAFSSNQSMRGVAERIPALDSVRGAAWAALTVLVLVLAVTAIEVSRRRGDTVAAMLSAGFIGLLCSPVSWGHHWVWLSAAAVYFLVRWAGTGGIPDLVGGLVAAVVTVVAPWQLLPSSDDRERLWSPFEHLLGSVWALTALVLLVVFATCARSSEVP